MGGERRVVADGLVAGGGLAELHRLGDGVGDGLAPLGFGVLFMCSKIL